MLLDATWFMPGVKRDPAKEFEERHLPGAQRWDHDGIASEHPLKLPYVLISYLEVASTLR